MASLVNVNRPTVGAYAKQVSHGGIFLYNVWFPGPLVLLFWILCDIFFGFYIQDASFITSTFICLHPIIHMA